MAGAIYSGFAMVLTLAIPCARSSACRTSSPIKHLENTAKVMLATGLIVGYAYLLESFTAWYSGNPSSKPLLEPHDGPTPLLLDPDRLQHRAARSALVQARAHRPGAALHLRRIVVLIGMWLERFVIIVSSLAQDFLPSSWHLYTPRAGTRLLTAAPSDCSCSCSSCSCACCP